MAPASHQKAPLPVIGIPTTAGTGSEVTHVAVVGDSKGFKMGVLHPAMFMKTAIIDGSLMLSLPPQLTSTTGMDSLGTRHRSLPEQESQSGVRYVCSVSHPRYCEMVA